MPQFVQDLLGQSYSPELFAAILKALIRIVFVLFTGYVALKLLDSGLRRLRFIVPPGDIAGAARVEQRAETLRYVARNVGSVVLGVIVLFTVARELGFDLASLLATASIAGIAIGFGTQSVVKDVLAGFFVLLEDQYGVGDVVRVGQQSGVVERMTLRVTVLRNLEGEVHVIPNGNIQSVTVLTKDWARAVVDVTVAHREELGRVYDVLERTGAELARDMADRILEKPQVFGVERLSEEGVTIRVGVKTPPLKQWDVMREWRRRIKIAFDREGIGVPERNRMVWSSEREEPVRKDSQKL